MIWRRVLPAFGAGGVSAFGLAPYGIAPLALLGLAALPWLMRDVSARTAGWIAWAFATGYFAHALHWIIEPFLVDAAQTGWMAPFALIFMAGGLALFWGLAGLLAHAVAQSWAGRSAALVVTLGLAEFVRAYALTGFPWAGLAQVWLDTGVEHTLAYIGPQGLGVVTLIVGFGLGHAVANAPWMNRAIALCPLGLAALGVLALNVTEPVVTFTGHTIRLVQPNAPQHQKWDPAYIPTFFNRQLSFTGEPGSPDLIVWPETAISNWLHEADPVLDAISDRAGETPVVLGLTRVNWPDALHNSLVVLDENGALSDIYDKHHLVPFGEYVPLRALAERIGLAGLAAQGGNFSHGTGPKAIDLGDIGTALPLICYEAVFPQHAGIAGVRPNLLLQITNDAWFGSWSGPFQHLAQARMRAIEQGLPMVRVANTGVSAMIDPLGRIVDSLPLNTAGYLDSVLPAPLPPTLYARIGDIPTFILLCLAVLFMRMRARRRL